MDKHVENMQRFQGERLGIISLGCCRNIVDSEKILGDAQSQGARICSIEKASTVLVNTCAFTREAKEESIGVILDLIDFKKKGKIKKIIVHGCLAQRYPKELRENFDEVDDFVGVADFKKSFNGSLRLTPSHYAYLKISEGCANLCSYCAIPQIKGPLKSRDEEAILEEVKALEDSGVGELNIVGQDITLFGWDRLSKSLKKPFKPQTSTPLVWLLKKILKSTAIPWIRLLYLHPARLSDDLIDLLASQKRICPYVDLPLQHINDRILKLMNRRVNKRAVVSLIEKLRTRIAGVGLRTTVIVGFPSETEREFHELLDFVRDVRFERLGAFPYSREEETKAYNFKGQIVESIKSKRYDALMSLQKEVSREILKQKLGKTVEVMVDEDRMLKDGLYIGRTQQDAPEVDGIVFLKSKTRLNLGSIVKAKITDTTEYDLVGEVVR